MLDNAAAAWRGHSAMKLRGGAMFSNPEKGNPCHRL